MRRTVKTRKQAPPKWAADLADCVRGHLSGLDPEDGGVCYEAIAKTFADHMEEWEYASAYFEWLFTGHCHAIWQAHQLSVWVRANKDKVPEAILKIAEAQP